MSNEDQQAADYSKMLQVAYELGLGQFFGDLQKTSMLFEVHFRT
jgi:hypothetical protein